MTEQKFDGVKWDPNDGRFYYEDGDVPTVPVKINYADMKGNVRITEAELKKWFKMDRTQLNIPKYLIANEFHWGDRYDTGYHQLYDLHGGLSVYQPIEFVPCCMQIGETAGNILGTSIHEKTVNVQKTSLYASATASLEVSAGVNYMGMRVDAHAKIEGGIETKKDTTRMREISQDGKVPPATPVIEVCVGLLLRAKKVYGHYVANSDVSACWYWDHTDHRLSWKHEGGWAKLWVGNDALQNVKGLQFHIEGHMYVQSLPVMKNGELVDVHMVFKRDDWKDWYAYLNGKKANYSTTHLMAYPGYTPLTTLMTFDDKR